MNGDSPTVKRGRVALALVMGVLSTLVLVGTAPPADAAVINSFDKVFSAQTNGAIAITGNSLLTCSTTGNAAGISCPASLAGTGTGSSGNNDLNMIKLDVDADASTTSSSMAR